MNKNYRYNRSTKNFQGGGENWKTGKPKNPKLSQAVAAGVTSALAGIGTALNLPDKEQRLENRLGRTRTRLKNATPGTGRFARLQERERTLNQKSMASMKRGGTYKSGGTKRKRK